MLRFSPECEYVFVWFSEWTAIIFLNSMNLSVFVCKVKSVFCEVETEFISTIQASLLCSFYSFHLPVISGSILLLCLRQLPSIFRLFRVINLRLSPLCIYIIYFVFTYILLAFTFLFLLRRMLTFPFHFFSLWVNSSCVCFFPTAPLLMFHSLVSCASSTSFHLPLLLFLFLFFNLQLLLHFLFARFLLTVLFYLFMYSLVFFFNISPLYTSSSFAFIRFVLMPWLSICFFLFFFLLGSSFYFFSHIILVVHRPTLNNFTLNLILIAMLSIFRKLRGHHEISSEYSNLLILSISCNVCSHRLLSLQTC